jgi:hypothetical protein
VARKSPDHTLRKAILYLSLTVSDSQALGCTTIFHTSHITTSATASPLCWWTAALNSVLLRNKLITFLQSLEFPFSQSLARFTQRASCELLLGIGAHMWQISSPNAPLALRARQVNFTSRSFALEQGSLDMYLFMGYIMNFLSLRQRCRWLKLKLFFRIYSGGARHECRPESPSSLVLDFHGFTHLFPTHILN